MGQRRRSRSNRLAPYASAAGRSIKYGAKLYQAYKSRNGGGKSRTKAKSGSRTSASMLTFQKDSKMQYVRKKMPYRKKKKWLSFVKKVKTVEATGRGTQQLILNDFFDTSVPAGTNPNGNRFQGISEVNLYSVNGAVQGTRDKDYILNEISNYREAKISAGEERPDTIAIDEELSRLKVPMNNAQIDISYTNTGNIPLEVDFYTITHRNVPANAYQTSPSVGSGLQSLESAQDYYNGVQLSKLYYKATVGVSDAPGTEVALRWRGVTPFQAWGIPKYTGGRVQNKTKVLISPGTTITRRYSDRRHRFIFPHSSNNNSRYDKDTTTYLAIIKPRDNFLGPSQQATLTTSFTKVYSWTQEGQKNPRQTYFGPAP